MISTTYLLAHHIPSAFLIALPFPKPPEVHLLWDYLLFRVVNDHAKLIGKDTWRVPFVKMKFGPQNHLLKNQGIFGGLARIIHETA
jgi:hypothetical protein